MSCYCHVGSQTKGSVPAVKPLAHASIAQHANSLAVILLAKYVHVYTTVCESRVITKDDVCLDVLVENFKYSMSDGRLLKPTHPVMSLDSTFVYRAFHSSGPNGQLWAAFTEVGRIVHVHVWLCSFLKGIPL